MILISSQKLVKSKNEIYFEPNLNLVVHFSKFSTSLWCSIDMTFVTTQLYFLSYCLETEVQFQVIQMAKKVMNLFYIQIHSQTFNALFAIFILRLLTAVVQFYLHNDSKIPAIVLFLRNLNERGWGYFTEIKIRRDFFVYLKIISKNLTKHEII